MSGEVPGFDSVQLWEKADTPPGEIEAEMIMSNVDRSGVPVFVEKEVYDINLPAGC